MVKAALMPVCFVVCCCFFGVFFLCCSFWANKDVYNVDNRLKALAVRVPSRATWVVGSRAPTYQIMRGSYAVYCAAKLLSVVYCILCIGPCYLCGIFFNYSRTGIVLGGMCLIVTLFVCSWRRSSVSVNIITGNRLANTKLPQQMGDGWGQVSLRVRYSLSQKSTTEVWTKRWSMDLSLRWVKTVD